MSAGGGRSDLIQGQIGRALLFFALPTLGSNILHSVNGSINAIWVGHFLGAHALAATANGNIIMFLMFTVVYGFGAASMVIVARCIGSGDIDGARRANGSAISFCFLLGMIVALTGYVFATDLLKMLRTPPQIFDAALTYLRVLLIAMPTTQLGFIMTSGLRGSGDPRTPLKFVMVSVVADILLNPILIHGLGPIPAFGIAGSAAASGLAGLISLISLTAYIYRRDLPLRLRGREIGYLRPAIDQIWLIMKKGAPMGMQAVVMPASSLLIIGLVNQEGLLTVAAYAAAQQIWTYLQMPAMAISSAVTAMAAQNIGARRWDRVGRITAFGLLYQFALTGLMIASILWFHRPLLALFLGGDSPAVDHGWHMQLIASWSFMLAGGAIIQFGVMRANGVVFMPLLIMIFSLFGVRLGFYLLAYPSLGADALWWSISAGSLVLLGLSSLAYRFSNWRQKDFVTPASEANETQPIDPEVEPIERIARVG